MGLTGPKSARVKVNMRLDLGARPAVGHGACIFARGVLQEAP
jgi:hypothetical protein